MLTSCHDAYIVRYKSVLPDKPYLAKYFYTSNGFDHYEMIDSATRYNIGDDVRKYSNK